MTIEDNEAKLAEYRAEIRRHELKVASIRRAMKIVESRLARLRKKGL